MEVHLGQKRIILLDPSLSYLGKISLISTTFTKEGRLCLHDDDTLRNPCLGDDALSCAALAPLEPDKVGVRVEGVDGEDDVGGDEGAAVLPGEDPGDGGAQQGRDLVEVADVEGLEGGAGEDGGVTGGDVEEAAVVA